MFKINTERNQLVLSKLSSNFPGAILQQEVIADMLCITITKESIYPVLLFLRDNIDLKYDFLTTLCGMHYPEKVQLGVVYHLHSLGNNHYLRVKTATEISNPILPTATTIWPSANWMERETFDFFGIRFEGHPNLVRILNVDDMVNFPLRKDFPLEDQTRDDKDDSMFGR